MVLNPEKKYGNILISWIANKTKIAKPGPEVLFERAVDAVLDAY